MTYKYQPSYGPADSPETISLHKMIGGKVYKLELKRQAFEKTMDRIDEDVDAGIGYRELCKKYKDHIVNIGEPVKKVEPISKGDKPAIIARIIADNPHFEMADVVNAASANGQMSKANARYLAMKQMG